MKLLKVNTETGSPITWEAIWSIWQSFPSSSLDLQFTISFFFSSSQGYSIPTTSPTAWESEGESFHVTPTPALGGTIPLLTELFPSIWVQFAVWALTSISVTFSRYSADTNRHFPLPQTWTCTPAPPPPSLPPTHAHTYMDAKLKLNHSFLQAEKVHRIITYCDICCLCWSNSSVRELFYVYV